MSAIVRRSVEVLVLAIAVASLVLTAAPVSAQVPIGEDPVSCDPENPEPDSQTECTAEGLEADSDFQWTAEFAEGTQVSGDGTADAEGVGTFTVDVPDEEGEYTVTVTGTDESGEPYEESFTGEVGGGESGLPLPAPGESEDPSEDPSEEPGEGDESGDDEVSDEEVSQDDDQVSPVPSGGVASGMGGLASSDGSGPATALILGLLALGGVAAYTMRRRTDH